MMTLLLVIIFICFIGVGLPDSILGAAWPTMYQELGVPISLAGYISATVSVCTIISSLISTRAIKKFGVGGVTAICTVMTAIALFGFAATRNPAFFFLFAIPLGLGAGSIDTALNNFVALHYSAAKMNFLHCFYGLGVAASPYLMSAALKYNGSWRKGYILVAVIQTIISLVALFALPLWKRVKKREDELDDENTKILSITEMLKMPTARMSCFAFFASCAVELTAGGWSSSYFVNTKGMTADSAAQIAMLFYIGLALGRFISGIASKKFTRWQIIVTSSLVMLVSIVLLLLPISTILSSVALFFIGFGIGPIYPNLTHLTPQLFGREISGCIMGLQQTACYVGIMIMPWLFGVLAQQLTTAIFPLYLLILGIVYLFSLTLLIKNQNQKGLNSKS